MKHFLGRYKLNLIGLILGASSGYLYYYYVGCYAGSCTLKSSPVNMTLYGALMGYLLFSLFQKEEKSSTKKNDV